MIILLVQSGLSTPHPQSFFTRKTPEGGVKGMADFVLKQRNQAYGSETFKPDRGRGRVQRHRPVRDHARTLSGVERICGVAKVEWIDREAGVRFGMCYAKEGDTGTGSFFYTKNPVHVM